MALSFATGMMMGGEGAPASLWNTGGKIGDLGTYDHINNLPDTFGTITVSDVKIESSGGGGFSIKYEGACADVSISACLACFAWVSDGKKYDWSGGFVDWAGDDPRRPTRDWGVCKGLVPLWYVAHTKNKFDKLVVFVVDGRHAGTITKKAKAVISKNDIKFI